MGVPKCGGCAARRAAEAAGKVEYRWTSSDGGTTYVYAKEEVAKAKVMRKGGSYVSIQKGSG